MPDLIERKDALDCLDNGDFDSYEDYSRTFDAIADIPAVNRWIPVSERLPEDNAEVLVSFVGGRYVKIGYIEPCDGLRYWVIPGHTVAPLDYVEAWMPRPDAYKPSEV